MVPPTPDISTPLGHMNIPLIPLCMPSDPKQIVYGATDHCMTEVSSIQLRRKKNMVWSVAPLEFVLHPKNRQKKRECWSKGLFTLYVYLIGLHLLLLCFTCTTICNKSIFFIYS